MKRKLLSLLALLCLTVSGAWADNEQGPTYTITLSGCDNTSYNITVNNATLPYVIDKIGELGWNLDAPSVVDYYCQDFTNVYVKSGGDGKVSVDYSRNKMTITITGAFDGQATIHCDAEGDVDDFQHYESRDIYVTCVSNGPYTVASGNCGTSGHEAEVTWSLNSDGVLTVSGTGAMNDFDDGTPWSSQVSSITSIVIESGVTSIGEFAFEGCSNLTTVSIPASVTSIGQYAFNSCGNSAATMTVSIAAESSLTTIGNSAFTDCSSLSSFNIPSGVISIQASAFKGCSSLTSVEIPHGVTEISTTTFRGCSSLTSVEIPNSVTSIGDGAFRECSSLTSVEIPNSVTSIGNRAFQSSGLTSFTIPNSVTTIAARAFEGCSDLTSVSISNSIATIGSYIFKGCVKLKTVEIPSSVTTIANNAFENCSLLTTLTVYAPTCSVYASSFSGCNNLQNIYVFSDKVNDYQAASNWSTYASKIQAIPALSANEGASNTEYWTTYYNDLTCATAPEGTQVFKVALSGSTLTLTEISDGVINMGEGVVLKSNSSSITLASAASTGTGAVGGYDDNDLTGTMNSITNPGNAYVLNKTATNGVGFYRLRSEGTIGAHKAYLTYDGELARGFFLFDEATGIEAIDNGQSTIDNVVYDLQGRRVAQPAKGLYIVNGKKYIKK